MKKECDSVDHEDDDNNKEPRFQNVHKKRHSEEQHTILEPASLLYRSSCNFTSMEVRSMYITLLSQSRR